MRYIYFFAKSVVESLSMLSQQYSQTHLDQPSLSTLTIRLHSHVSYSPGPIVAAFFWRGGV